MYVIVPTRAHRYTQVIWLSGETAALMRFCTAMSWTTQSATWVKA